MDKRPNYLPGRIKRVLCRRMPLAQKSMQYGNALKRAERNDLYYYFQAVDEVDGAWVWTQGQRKLMFATYSYLGLLQHPRIMAAAQAALEKYGAGTYGVRILGGTLDLHEQLEARIARFTNREDAIAYSSGYVTNLATVSTLVGRGDLGHLRPVEPCEYCGWLSVGAGRVSAFPHDDMADLNGDCNRRRKRPVNCGGRCRFSAWTVIFLTCPPMS